MTVVMATNNPNKVKEIQKVVGEGYEWLLAKDIDPKVDWNEVGSTFEENARIKARVVHRLLIAQNLNYAVLAEDSGLCVDALDGAPGIHSARYGGSHGDAVANNQKLLKAMQQVPEGERQAHFHCSLIYLDIDGSEKHFEAQCHGQIALGLQGKAGFGYDPLFCPDGEVRTLSELGPEVKSQISHRSQALKLWMQELLGKS